MQGNPIADEKGDDIRKELIMLSLNNIKELKKINKEEVTDDDITDAKATIEDRRL